MRYDDLRCEALAWGELKAKLGHFSAPRDKSLYLRRMTEILDETARQAHNKLNATQEPQRIAAVLESEALPVF